MSALAGALHYIREMKRLLNERKAGSELHVPDAETEIWLDGVTKKTRRQIGNVAEIKGMRSAATSLIIYYRFFGFQRNWVG